MHTVLSPIAVFYGAGVPFSPPNLPPCGGSPVAGGGGRQAAGRWFDTQRTHRVLPRARRRPFLAVLNWNAPFEEVAQAHELFGRDAIALLRAG